MYIRALRCALRRVLRRALRRGAVRIKTRVTARGKARVCAGLLGIRMAHGDSDSVTISEGGSRQPPPTTLFGDSDIYNYLCAHHGACAVPGKAQACCGNERGLPDLFHSFYIVRAILEIVTVSLSPEGGFKAAAPHGAVWI